LRDDPNDKVVDISDLRTKIDQQRRKLTIKNREKTKTKLRTV
jgi:hypothetical protein